MSRPRWRRIARDEVSPTRSPSGLPTHHLVDASMGSTALFIAEQTLQPGDRVLRHVHPLDEVLMFLSGSGVATLDGDDVPVAAGTTLFVPAGVQHGFHNGGGPPLRVIVIFAGGSFAETTLLEPRIDGAVTENLA